MKIPKPNSSYLIHFLLGVFAILWGLSNLYPIELFEFRMVEQSLCNWTTAPFISRIYIAIMFFIGASMLFYMNPKNIITKLYLGCLTIPIFDLFWGKINSNEIIKESYASIFNTNNELIYILYSISIAGSSYLIYKKSNANVKFRWVKYMLSLVCLALPFILNPIYPENFTDQSESITDDISFDDLNYSNLKNNNSNTIFAFFSTSCPYCILAAKKMQVAQKLDSNFPDVHIFFIGSKEGVDYFFEESNTQFEYSIPEQNSFLKIAGNSFPSFIYSEKGVPQKKYTGRTFNFHAMSTYSSL